MGIRGRAFRQPPVPGEPVPYLYVIDDDELMARVLSARLKKRGHRVRTYFRAEQALEQLKFDTPDAILTDLNMPGMSGLDLLGEIRRLDFSLPAILVTGTEECRDIIEAFRLGFVDVVRKPPKDKEIEDALHKALISLGDSLEILVREPVVSIVDQIQDGLIVLDRTSKVRMVNRAACRILSLDGEDLQEELDFAIGIGLKGLVRKTLLSPEKRLSMEVSMSRLNRPRLVWLESLPSRSPRGDETGVLVVLRDLNGQGRLDQAKSRLMGLVSHELNTPLTAIRNAVKILGQEDGNGERRRFVDIANQNVKRLSLVVDRFLESSRRDVDRDTMERTLFGLEDLLLEDELRSFLGGKCELRLTTPEKLPVMLGDRRRLHLMVKDLVHVSGQAVPEGSTLQLEVRTARWDDPVPGEPERKNMERLARVWFRLGPIFGSMATDELREVKESEAAKRLVEDHGGHFWLEEEDAGAVCFTLPLEPTYDSNFDFLNPLTSVKGIAGEMERPYTLLRIEVDQGRVGVRPDWHPRLKECLLRVFPSEFICRGREGGDYYVFAVGISAAEANAALRRLGNLYGESMGLRGSKSNHLLKTNVFYHDGPSEETPGDDLEVLDRQLQSGESGTGEPAASDREVIVSRRNESVPS